MEDDVKHCLDCVHFNIQYCVCELDDDIAHPLDIACAAFEEDESD